MPDTYLMRTDISATTKIGYGAVTTAQVERLFNKNKGLTIQKPLMMSSLVLSVHYDHGLIYLQRPNGFAFASFLLCLQQKWLRLVFSLRAPNGRVLGLCQK